ncbi:SusD/RagB family nutrient-binding outer membrane lipoprotein [Solitalea canadensis]|uniref:SusD/RagB family nutrient-binding outer membrane lipoprotein n=1 Tax=Solitalea canadensis (strain ATCC 29591 / DSM 3403 / JCM 21819 / LMG 8368 / NBRC 15130 / NCIMB 12057 / USAM 9D) TaxID=929556 RepID=H8KXB7_SOLCM|nr:SusD/RagB family nutrient-binding outer membrane lipoprotein [Solitalea canadensis]AFD08446.1 hypothetical protein Solca_3441 [Solitalea canadensis DSM 3403]
MRINLYRISIVIFSLMAFSSCNDYLDINTDPNRPTTPPINGLLASATYNTAQNVYELGVITSYFTQYLASPNEASPTDIYDEVDYSTTWKAFYSNMADIYDLKNMAIEKQSPGHKGIADVLMVMNLSMVVDVWGDVPYSQAFGGEVLRPAYDNQEQLYNTMLGLLDEAIVEFAKPDADKFLTATNDFIHQANLTRWTKTAHALKARLLNHFSKQSSYNPTAVLAEIDQAYVANIEDAQVAEFLNRNPWAQVAVDNASNLLGGWLSSTILNAMNGTTYTVVDSRLTAVTLPNKNGLYVGTRNGAGRVSGGTGDDECYLQNSTFYALDTSPLTIITFSELKFIEAEAAFRAGNSTRAYSAYEAGIKANFAKVGLTVDGTTYFQNPSVGVGAAGLTLDLIFKEKYVAMFLNPEAWVDARRYDYNYTNFTLPLNVNTNINGFIRRVAYPSSEIATNAKNMPQVKLDDRLFWDK